MNLFFFLFIRTFAVNMMAMKKILFLHGFYASGQCIPALALTDAFDGVAEVLTPDLPLHPKEALTFIYDLCEEEQPDVLVGNSCGSFYGQMVAAKNGLPALLGNPYFRMTEFLKPRIGQQRYKAPRTNGIQEFLIDDKLITEFAELEACQFDFSLQTHQNQIWGLFGEQDTLAHFEPLYLEHYTKTFHFPGGHTPTADEVRTWYVPLIKELLNHKW